MTQQTPKRIYLENKLQSALEKAGKRKEANMKRFKHLAKKVAEMNYEKKSRGPAKKKSNLKSIVLKTVNFTYTILNEKEMAMAKKGNYSLAIIKTTESYEALQESLTDRRHEMELLKNITINNRTYDIEYFLGGDWKFFACVRGLGAANQD